MKSVDGNAAPAKAEQSTQEVIPRTAAEHGKPLPIVYGTCKVQPYLIERKAPKEGLYPEWRPLMDYSPGDCVTASGNVYQCIVGGGSPVGGSGPSGTAPDIQDGPVHWAYLQACPALTWKHSFVAALAEGPIEGAAALWFGPEKSAALTNTRLRHGLTVTRGIGQQATVGYDPSGYPNTALLMSNCMIPSRCFTGSQQELPETAVELRGRLSAVDTDPNPADVIADILCDERIGCSWPKERIHPSIGSGAGAYRVYCDAAGLRFSMIIDAQQKAQTLLAGILEATNAEAVMSQGRLKILPLGDQPISAPVYGTQPYEPDNSVAYDLSPDDFLSPIKTERRSDADCYNSHLIEATVRSEGYVRTAIENGDFADVDARGLRRAPQIASLPVVFPDGAPLAQLSRIKTQRSLYCRNEFRFSLGFRHLLLEPGDRCTLTDPVLGLDHWPVRITEISERDGGGLDIVAIDWPASVGHTARYAVAAGEGYAPNNERPTLTSVVRVIDPLRLMLQAQCTGNQVFPTGTPAIPEWTNPVSNLGNMLQPVVLYPGGRNTNQFVAPLDGFYAIAADIQAAATTGASELYADLWVNMHQFTFWQPGSHPRIQQYGAQRIDDPRAGQIYGLTFYLPCLKLMAGDVVSFVVSAPASPQWSTVTVYGANGNSIGTYLNVRRL